MQKTIKLGAYGLIIWQKYEIVKVQKRNLNPHFEAFISNWNLLFHLSPMVTENSFCVMDNCASLSNIRSLIVIYSHSLSSPTPLYVLISFQYYVLLFNNMNYILKQNACQLF